MLHRHLERQAGEPGTQGDAFSHASSGYPGTALGDTGALGEAHAIRTARVANVAGAAAKQIRYRAQTHQRALQMTPVMPQLDHDARTTFVSSPTAGSNGTFAFLTRRRLLQLGLAGSAVLVAGGVGHRLLLGPTPEVAGLTTLSNREYKTLDTLARTLLPAGGPFELGAEKLDLARAFDTFLAGEHPSNVTKLRRALALFELGPVLFEHRLVTFSNLPPGERARHYQTWVDSDTLLLRQVAVAFRKFLTLVFYDRQEAWPAIGYPGPSLLRRSQ